MQTTITARHGEIPEDLRARAGVLVERLALRTTRPTSAHVTFVIERLRAEAEIVLSAARGVTYVAKAEADDARTALDRDSGMVEAMQTRINSLQTDIINRDDPAQQASMRQLLAKAIGEESFVDNNGNGAFDNGETYTDLAEPFRDDDEDSAYDPGEDFFDFNNNQARDPADAIFNGVLCNDTSGRCGALATRSTGIAEQNKIILSGSTPVVTLPGGAALPASIAVGALSSAVSVSFWVRDANNNVMPGGTTVALSASGGGLSVSAPSSFTVPCSAIAAGVEFPGITAFSFTVTSGSQPGSGVLTLTVTTPSGLVSIRQMNATVP